jgi:glycosyltransferase involved in cell wall biosynthesis
VRIAQVVPRGEQPWSGVLTVIVNLSAALAKLGHKVEVWQLHDWSPDAYTEQQKQLKTAGVNQLRIGADSPLWRLGSIARTLVAERGIDVIHLHGAFNTSNTAISRGLRSPYVFSPHSGYDPVSLRRSGGRKLLYRLLFERMTLNRAALVVALTDVELDQLREFRATGPFAVIPNGVATSISGVDRHALRRQLGIPSDAELVVFVGRLDVYRKGLDLLVRGIAHAPSWHLALVGPRFRDVPRLEREIAEREVGDRVHSVGERHGGLLQEALAGGELFALMSRWEGLPMALLEALSYGTPAVVSPAVERVVAVEAAGAGWVAGSDDLGALLRYLHQDGQAELATRGQAAMVLAGRYDWDAVARQYEAAYERACRSRESAER